MALVVLGSGWYVRAWAATGNPLWPYQVELAGAVVFEGRVDPARANPTPTPIAELPEPLQPARSWLADLDVPARMETDPRRPDARLGGLGLVWLLVGIPGAIAALGLSLTRRDARFAVLTFAVGMPALFATPDAWWSRFTIPLAALGLAGFAYTATRLPTAVAHAASGFAIALAVVGVVETRPLGPLDQLRNTPGVPRERPAQRPDGLEYEALSLLSERARVGVILGSPLLPYLTIGERFRREVVPLRRRPSSGRELAHFTESRNLEYVVSRNPLPASLTNEAGLLLVAQSSGATVYRVEPDRAAADRL